MSKVIVASGNVGKLREFKRIFAAYGIEAQAQSELLPELSVEETGTTFGENAYLKAAAVHESTGLAAVADDSGICIDAFDGEPGVYSSRYLGEHTPYSEKNRLILERLRGVPRQKRGAHYTAHICYIDESGKRVDFEQTCEGYIGLEPAGDGGFGYDPIFYVGERSFGEFSDSEKDAVSHRGKALRALADYLKTQNNGKGQSEYADK